MREGIEGTRAFVTDLFASVKQGVAAGKDLRAVYKETYAALKPKFGHWVIFDHCMPFDVTRAYDEATQYPRPADLDRRARQGDVGAAGRLNREPGSARRNAQWKKIIKVSTSIQSLARPGSG